jgi:hypothetical protein
MTKKATAPMMNKAPSTTPMLIPAFAPVFRPLDELDEDDALDVPELVAAALVEDASDDVADANDFVATTVAEDRAEDDAGDVVLEEEEPTDAAVRLKK